MTGTAEQQTQYLMSTHFKCLSTAKLHYSNPCVSGHVLNYHITYIYLSSYRLFLLLLLYFGCATNHRSIPFIYRLHLLVHGSSGSPSVFSGVYVAQVHDGVEHEVKRYHNGLSEHVLEFLFHLWSLSPPFFVGGGSKASLLGITLKREIIRIPDSLNFAIKEYTVFIFKTNLL